MFVDFRRPDAVFEATGAASFAETVEASVTDSAGERAYWLKLRIEHQATPLGYHAAGDVGGTGGIWGMVAELEKTLGDVPVDIRGGMVPDSIDVIRLGDDFWTYGAGGWSGPRASDYVMVLGRTTPVRSLSSALQSIIWSPGVTPSAHEDVGGRMVARYRFVDDRGRMTAAWNAIAAELPSEPLPRDAKGTLDLWLHESGLLVRARLYAEDARGRVFTVAFDVGGFDEPVDIAPPSGGS